MNRNAVWQYLCMCLLVRERRMPTCFKVAVKYKVETPAQEMTSCSEFTEVSLLPGASYAVFFLLMPYLKTTSSSSSALLVGKSVRGQWLVNLSTTAQMRKCVWLSCG